MRLGTEPESENVKNRIFFRLDLEFMTHQYCELINFYANPNSPECQVRISSEFYGQFSLVDTFGALVKSWTIYGTAELILLN